MKIDVFTSKQIVSKIHTNRFFDGPVVPTPVVPTSVVPTPVVPGPTPADKIAELKALMLEVGTLITEGKAVITTVEQMLSDLKAFLGK